MSVTSPSPAQMGPGQVQFRLHGPDSAVVSRADEVDAAVFAAKLSVLVRALKAADRVANGRSLHTFNIFKLASSTPTVTLSERTSREHMFPVRSGVSAFAQCADAITSGNTAEAQRFERCAQYIGQLGKGARKTFGYGELWTAPDRVLRVDEFLVERSQAAVRPAQVFAVEAPPREGSWFSGIAYGSFDGIVQAVDLRGALPEVKLVLSAGKKQIDCVFQADDIEVLRASLNRRVRLTGKAIYDGRSGLPRRIERPTVDLLDDGADLRPWKGAFEIVGDTAWEEDGE